MKNLSSDLRGCRCQSEFVDRYKRIFVSPHQGIPTAAKPRSTFASFLSRVLYAALVAIASALGQANTSLGAAFDAAPFAQILPEGNGLIWEDPREIHSVIVTFSGPVVAGKVNLEYWGSRWPEQHLPKDRAPGGGDVGWMELGNWFQGGWRVADAEATVNGSTVAFRFHPVNAREFPNLKDYPAAFRYSLKLRVAPADASQKIERFVVETDSTVESRDLVLSWKDPAISNVRVTAFNGQIEQTETTPGRTRTRCICTVNPDPNTFDRTLVSVQVGTNTFTFAPDNIKQGPLFLPEFGVAVSVGDEARDYAAVEADRRSLKGQSLYDRVRELPEQTWTKAWSGMPPKKSRIYFPLGLDGGRERFLLQADGTIRFRLNYNFL